VNSAFGPKLPSISPYAYQARYGGLMAYGLDLHDLYRQTAHSVDRILKGTKPSELPIELPTRWSWSSTSRLQRCWA
jgi:putative ABC transport system substrate-binding protein